LIVQVKFFPPKRREKNLEKNKNKRQKQATNFVGGRYQS
jgi:hypothetical protein